MAVIDLDDTLLSPNKQISEANLEALDALRRNFFEIVIASGRHHKNILGFEDRIGKQGWVISSNGAVVRHARTSAMLRELMLTRGQSADVYRYGSEKGLTIIGYHTDGIFAEEVSEWTQRYAQNAGWQPSRGDLSLLARTGLQKLLLTHSAKRIDEIQRTRSNALARKCMLSGPQTRFWRLQPQRLTRRWARRPWQRPSGSTAETSSHSAMETTMLNC
jgi:hydroxymethylpyrimidine pyrophosphatase-like HAD family hydrolase